MIDWNSSGRLFHSLWPLKVNERWPAAVLQSGICRWSLFLVLQLCTSDLVLNFWQRYGGASPFKHLNTMVASLNASCLIIGNSVNWFKATCSHFLNRAGNNDTPYFQAMTINYVQSNKTVLKPCHIYNALSSSSWSSLNAIEIKAPSLWGHLKNYAHFCLHQRKMLSTICHFLLSPNGSYFVNFHCYLWINHFCIPRTFLLSNYGNNWDWVVENTYCFGNFVNLVII